MKRIEPDTFKTSDQFPALPAESVSDPKTDAQFMLTPSLLKELSNITDIISEIHFATTQLKTDTNRIEGWIINLHSSIMEVGSKCDYLEELILGQERAMKDMNKRMERLEAKLQIRKGGVYANGAGTPTLLSSGGYSSGKNKQPIRIPGASSSF